MGGRRPFVRLVAVAIAATLALTGCVFGSGDRDEAAAELGLYRGPIPDPLALPTAPQLPEIPAVPTDPSDNAAWDAFNVEMIAYQTAFAVTQDAIMAHGTAVQDAANLTKAGGAQAVAAWQSLLVLAGVAVAGPDGHPLELDGQTGFGWPMSDGELRIQSYLGAVQGGMRLGDLAYALEGAPQFEGVDTTTWLYESLKAAAGNANDHFGSVMAALSSDHGYLHEPVTFTERAAAEVELTWGQVGLLLRRLGAEFAVSGAQTAAADDGASSTLPGLTIEPASFVQAAAAAPCDLQGDPWAEGMIPQVFKGSAFGVDKTLEAQWHQPEGGGPHAGERAKTKLGIARLLLALASLIARATALEASFSLAGAPLVRTKTTQPGELRELTISYAYDPEKWEDLRRCINLFMGPLGLELPHIESGAAAGIEVDLSSEDPSILRIGDGRGGSKVVTNGATGDDGKVAFTLSGAPQEDLIPEAAEAVDIEVGLRAVSNLGQNDLGKDLQSLPWDALDAAGSGGLTAIPQILSRMKLLTHYGVADVRDWALAAEFEVTAVGTMATRSAHNSYGAGGGCAASWANNSSTQATMSFASAAVSVTATLFSNPQGNLGDQAVVFYETDGPGFFPVGGPPDGVRFFTLPIDYRTDKSHSEPGVGTMPDPYEVPPSNNCGDGGGGGGQPTPPDCGVREYAGTLAVTVPTPRTLYVSNAGFMHSGDLWQECGSSVLPSDPPGVPSLEQCPNPKRSGGKTPSINDIFDTEKRKIEVNGSLTCAREGNGTLSEVEFEWTLVFCRVVEDEASCRD